MDWSHLQNESLYWTHLQNGSLYWTHLQNGSLYWTHVQSGSLYSRMNHATRLTSSMKCMENGSLTELTSSLNFSSISHQLASLTLRSDKSESTLSRSSLFCDVKAALSFSSSSLRCLRKMSSVSWPQSLSLS